MNFDISSPDWSMFTERYDTFFVDLVGVVHDGIDAFSDAIHALNQLPENKNLIFVSNNPRPSELSFKKLRNFKLERLFAVVTSGDFARHMLNLEKAATYYHWDAARNTDLLAGLDLKMTDNLDRAEKVLLTAFLDEQEDETQFDELINQIIAKKLPVFCANPDKYALYGKKMRKCAGYFAEKLMHKGVDVTIWGKPNVVFYDFIACRYPETVSDKKRCLMIGDTLETDILGASLYGIDSLLVLSGITGKLQQTHVSSPNTFPADLRPSYIWDQLRA